MVLKEPILRFIKRPSYNPEDYKNYLEFMEDDFFDVPDKEDVSYSLRHYLPWAMDHYGVWLKNYHENAVLYAGNTSLIEGKPHADVFEAFTMYSGWSYSHLADKYIEIMDREFEKDIATLTDNIVVYRVTDKRLFFERANVNRINTGDVIYMSGFLSSSLVKSLLIENDEYKDKYDLCIKFYVPKGCRCLFLEYISHRFHEQEMLFARNQKIKILDIEKGKKVTNIVAKIIPN